MNRYLAFQIEKRGDSSSFIGRVCGDRVEVGDMFTQRFMVRLNEREGEVFADISQTSTISVIATKIIYWNKEFTSIEKGLVCQIWFDGDTSEIIEKDLLGDDDTFGEYYAEQDAIAMRRGANKMLR